MDSQYRYLMFQLDNRTYALPLESVQRVLRVVDIVPVPDSPPVMEGVINLHGDIVPVFNLRRWFKLPETPIRLNDRLILVQTGETMAAFLVDAVLDILEPPLIEVMRAQKVQIQSKILQGVLEHHGEAVYLCNLEAIPSLEVPEVPPDDLAVLMGAERDDH